MKFLRYISLFVLAVTLSGCLIHQGYNEHRRLADTIPASKGHDLYLLIGQSNMAGRGRIEMVDQIIHPQVFMLNKDSVWVAAKEPLHFDKPDYVGTGPGFSFGKAMAEFAPEASIGLIPSAVGGSPISVWQPGAYYAATKTYPYDDAIERAKRAMKDGKLKAILWHQGESDANPKKSPHYHDALSQLVTNLRRDLAAPEVPFIVGGLGEFHQKKTGDVEKISAILEQATDVITHTRFVSASGLTDKGDKIHFDAKSARELGQRYAAALRSMHPASRAKATVDLRWRDDETAPFRATSQLTVPANHVIHDRMFPYEGIGWESEFAGYRLFLDERSAIDMFGKQRPGPALEAIGDASGSYHELAPWGMDILHVGPSRGIGGLGQLRDGMPTQLGKVGAMQAKIYPDDKNAQFAVDYEGVTSIEGRKANIRAFYSMSPTSPITSVSVKSSGGEIQLTTGIVAHPELSAFTSPIATGPWHYIASFGAQSENKDKLGLAIFYRSDQAQSGGTANETHFITFTTSTFDYKFVGVWEKDQNAITTQAAFKAYLDHALANMN